MPHTAAFSDDGKKLSAVVVQLGRRKPLLKKLVGGASTEMPDSNCPAPVWERAPSRVTFEAKGEPKLTYTARTRALDVAIEKGAGEDSPKINTNKDDE